MIEINAVAGEQRKDGPSAPRPQSPTAFRSFLDSLGGTPKAAEAPARHPESGAESHRATSGTRGPDAAAPLAEASPSPCDPKPARELVPARKSLETAVPTPRKAERGHAAIRSQASARDGETKPGAGTVEPVLASGSKAASEEVEPVVEAVEVTEDKPAEDWQDVVAKTLGLLGLAVDPAKLKGLSGQELRELDVALRAGLKGLTEGQPVAQVAKVVGELLPVPLQSVLPEAQPSQGQASQAVPDAASVPGPVREHKTQELGRLAEKMSELVRPGLEQGDPTATSKGKEKGAFSSALAAGVPSGEELPVQPVAAAKEGASVETATVPALPKGPEAAKPRKEDPSAFLRLDPAGFQIQRTDLQESAKAEPKAPVFRPAGPAGEMLAHQVYDEFQLRPGMDHREMVLKLWPRELGQVSVHIKMAENERVEAKILVQNENIRQALIEHTPVLRETLAKQGLELGSLSVSVGGGDAQSFGSQSGREGSSRRRGHAWEDGVLETSVSVTAGSDTGRRNGFNSIDMLT